MLFICPCCGYRTLPEKAVPTNAQSVTPPVCQVCAWGLAESGPEVVEDRDLLGAQREFLRSGVCAPNLCNVGRAARPEEARPEWWTFSDEAPSILIALIDEAFDSVTLDGGVSMEDAEQIDNYEQPARRGRPSPIGLGIGPSWRTIDVEEVDHGNVTFTFHDVRGVRYYLPAIMRAHLLDPAPGALVEPMLERLSRERSFEELSQFLLEPQRHAVARFLAVPAWSSTTSPMASPYSHGWLSSTATDRLATPHSEFRRGS